MQISRTNQEALSSTGINLTHVPSGGKNSADRSLLVDLMYWVSQNPPPAHLFLISGDRDFAGILHRLRMNNYNILLASPDSAPSVLCSAATIMWQWNSLLKGENLTGKLFNQPPDGPYNSWYGHYKAPLEDPFAVMEQSSCLRADESSELASYPKLRPIPKAVMKHICQILNSYPEGIGITQLRAELTKSNLMIDRDLYGYRKFSRFLLAMPHVLKLHSADDGQFLVRGVNTKFLDESVPATYVEPVTNKGEPEVGSVPETNGERCSCEDVTENSTLPPVPEAKVKALPTNLQEAQKEGKQNESSLSMNMQGIKMKAYATNLQDPEKGEKRKESPPKRNTHEIREQKRKVKLLEQPQKVEVASPVVKIKDFSEKNEKQMLVPSDSSSTSEFGILRRILMKWFGSGDTNSSDKNCLKRDEALSGKDITEEKTLISCQSSESVCPALFSPSSHEALIDGKIARSGVTGVTDTFSQDSRFFSQTMSWFRFWGSPEYDDKVEKNGETADQVKVNPKQLEIFSKESFWNELESFIDTSHGSASFSQSRTREHLVQNLKTQGPPVLRSLSESDLLQLVDLLISEKKWVEECDSRTFPFRLTRPAGKAPRDNPPLSSNGLSQIFSGRQPNLPEFGERKHQNPPHTGVPQPVVHKGFSSKPRSELLADCQKLVDHIVKEYPEGFNIGSFRKLFLEKHGYALDLQKLGYEKLVNLLQIMPGVRIESNLIFPAGAFKSLDLQNIDLPIRESKVGPVDSHSDSLVLSPKDDDSDSSWDELGPVDNLGPEKEEIDTGLTRKGKKRRTERKLPDYEPLQEDDLSDSEEETSSAKSENDIKSRLKEEESSLLQILDSWYSERGCDSRKDKLTSITSEIDGAEIGSQPSAPTGSGTKNESPVVNPTRKQKPVKSYSFVAEQPVDSNDKLVDGILGSMKKSGERSADSRVLG
ncbi:hypothetical protein Pfo_007705 [Paulownia fortunei]|nr:hypothetical protein Pfo_007705 [Paulownia fortunei]